MSSTVPSTDGSPKISSHSTAVERGGQRGKLPRERHSPGPNLALNGPVTQWSNAPTANPIFVYFKF